MTAIFQVNAFSDQPFGGNPAAVCILDEAVSDSWMQNIAAQMNLSETAFIQPAQDALTLRWFTPLKEVDMCGHATLASAHCLWEQGIVSRQQAITFTTLSGDLGARLNNGLIELDFPCLKPEPITPPLALINTLGITPLYCGMFGEKHLFEIDNEAQLLALAPDFAALKQLPGRGVTITCRTPSAGLDFKSRYFAPWVGINEDPVNGSSHCALTPYWAQKLNKQQLTAYQASQRGGVLNLELTGNRVKIAGKAKTLLEGKLCI